MRTSTFKLSTSQQIVFSVVITLALLFAGCSDSSNPINSGTDSSPKLEGKWVDLNSLNRGKNSITHELTFQRSVGIYEVKDPADTDECGIYPKLSKVFDYEITDHSTLKLNVKFHAECGVQKQAGEEEVYYSLAEDNLRIFNRTFIRE